MVPDTHYNITVQAIKNGFENGISSEISAITLSSIPPDAPELSISGVGQFTANFSWNAVEPQTYNIASYILIITTQSTSIVSCMIILQIFSSKKNKYIFWFHIIFDIYTSCI